MYNKDYEDGSITFFQDIGEYMALPSSLEVGTDRFDLAINSNSTPRREFCKRQPVGKNSFINIVKNSCTTDGIEGSGSKHWVTIHWLRGTLATLLFENSHSE